MSSFKCRAPFLAFGFLVVATPFALADSIDELRVLVDGSDAAAWDMAQRLEPDNAGDPEFDFWFGLAAKAAGMQSQSVFAFERVVQNQPANARAKLELADVYYQHGNTREARLLFEEVLATTPPEPVQQRIRTYLGAIGATEKRRSTQTSGFLSLAGGHDSNINGSTGITEHNIGVFTVTLDPISVETAASFMDVRAGIDIVKPVNQRELHFLSMVAQRRDNEQVLQGGNFDNSQLSITGGKILRRGTATWRLPISVQGLWAESESTGPADDDRFVATLGAEYNRSLAANTGITWFGQVGTIQYPSSDDRDASMFLVGAGYNWNAAMRPLRLAGTLHVGTEPSDNDTFDYNGRSYVAARFSVRYALSASGSLYGSVGAQQSMYQGTHPLLLEERKDMLLDASLGWQWQVDKEWNVNADVSWADNTSKNNDLYDYDRTQVKLGATWRF